MAEQPRISQLVVVGASAGGVEALSTLVATLPRAFPAPLVIAQHLDPGRPSHLAEILARRSTLPVRTVSDHAPLENGVVFVVPANRHVAITDHAISLRTDDGGRVMPSVDLLLSTAAQAFGENLIGVILSGTGNDGAAGARAVKEAGGTVVVQNPATAQFGAMPAAIAAPLVDVVAELEQLGPLVHDLLTGAYLPAAPADNPALRALLDELEQARGIRFSQYKMPTIQRRLQRRLAATGCQRLADYVAYLHGHPEEYERLVSTFLIKVTEFFRDPELFSHLRASVLPEIVAQAAAHDRAIRLWSAGCATGEEAYSLAILLAEVLGPDLERYHVRLFATDLDQAAVAYARRGIYPTNALAGLERELVERYFTLLDGAYQVNKRVRGLLVFGEHDLGQRAPFPHIDLCLCRNVLIYFAPPLQQRALQLFAFSVRDRGYLVLGKSETPGPLSEFFAPAHPHLKVYRRHGDRLLVPAMRIRQTVPQAAHARAARRPAPRPVVPAPALPHARTSTDDEAALLRALTWGVLVVDRHYDIQRINPAGRHLLGLHGAGVGEDLVHLTEELPAPGLRAAIDAVLGGAAEQDLVLRAETPQGQVRHLRLFLRPYTRGEGEGETPAPNEAQVQIMVTDVTALEEAHAAEVAALRAEHSRLQDGQQRALLLAVHLGARLLRASKVIAKLEAANQQLGASNAELRSANEEFVVGSEELQAAMEEVETLNEEMQASNEELETLNEELQATIEELHTTNDDLQARNLEMQELTAEREEQRQRSEAERARLAAVLLSMGEAVFVVDRSGAVVLANAAVERLLGPGGADFVPQDEEGQPLPAAQTPRARAARGETFSMMFTLPGPDGVQRWFEATGQPIQSGGVDQGSVVVIRDITERSLRRMQEQFLALVSHELRTPLTPIHGYLTLLSRLLQAESTDERARRYLARMQEQMQRLQRLVDDLLEVERLQEGKLQLDHEQVDLVPLVQGLVEALQATTDGPRVELAVAEGPLVVSGDATRLSQVVLNLLSNAAKHAPDSPRIELRLRREAGEALLEVQDHGPGIPAAALPHLFDRFYQAAGRTADDGLGVGLFITRELVRAHGGAIEVRSTEGAGATFTVRLPLLAPPEEAGPTSMPDVKKPS